MSKEGSDSSYSVDENDPVVKPPPAPQAPADAPAKKDSCDAGSCCCRCPFRKLGSENLEATLEEHPVAVQRIQEMMMFRRPVAAAVLFAVINLHFLVYGVLDLPFLSQVCFFALYALVFKLVWPMVRPPAEAFLFGQDVPQGEGEELNRVRSAKEVAAALTKVVGPIEQSVKAIRRAASDGSIVGRGIYAGVLLCLLILSHEVNVFWVTVVIVDLALVLPGVLLHPKVSPMIAELKGKVKKE